MPKDNNREQILELKEDNEDNKFIEHDQDITTQIFNKVKPIVLFVNSVSGIYIFWLIMHFISAHLYVYYCANYSLQGIVMSPILVSAPHCKALRWVIYNGAHSIDSMWIVFGTWISSKILLIGRAE